MEPDSAQEFIDCFFGYVDYYVVQPFLDFTNKHYEFEVLLTYGFDYLKDIARIKDWKTFCKKHVYNYEKHLTPIQIEELNKIQSEA